MIMWHVKQFLEKYWLACMVVKGVTIPFDWIKSDLVSIVSAQIMATLRIHMNERKLFLVAPVWPFPVIDSIPLCSYVLPDHMQTLFTEFSDKGPKNTLSKGQTLSPTIFLDPFPELKGKAVQNIATGETSQAITPFHYFDNFNFHHCITFITRYLSSQDNFHH